MIHTWYPLPARSKQDYDRLIPIPQHRHLGPTQYSITAYGGYTIKTLGTCPLYVHQNGSIKEIISNVSDVPGPAMLGCKTCEELELVKFNCSLETSKEDNNTHPKEPTHHTNHNRGPAKTIAVQIFKRPL